MARRLLIVAMVLSNGMGFPNYRDRIPNSRSFSDIKALGHVDPDGGGRRNGFGLDFGSNGFDWTEICELDSDNDGLTNGQELGDPCCQWTSFNPTELIDTGLSHPGQATDVSENPKLIKPACNNDAKDDESTTGIDESKIDESSTVKKIESNERKKEDRKENAAASSLPVFCLLWSLVVSNLIFF